ncbi:hypothetical protein LXL04_000035 [Taraxacum kok-saghyz]
MALGWLDLLMRRELISSLSRSSNPSSVARQRERYEGDRRAPGRSRRTTREIERQEADAEKPGRPQSGAATTDDHPSAIIDADGTDLGIYRKSHIPDGPGDIGFKVFQTKFAKIGVAICWDQWFPEAARAIVLQSAELLFYPTAIGSEPQDQCLDSRDH